MNRSTTRTVGPIVLATLSLAALTACAGDPPSSGAADAGQDPSVSEQAAGTSGSASPTPDPQPDQTVTPGAGSPAGQERSVRTMRLAGDTALAELGGTVVTLDSEPNGWEVQVVLDDGSEREVLVSADGASVAAGPFRDRDDSEDLRENRAMLEAASLDHTDALRAVRREMPDAQVLDLDLELDGGAAWEASVADGSGLEQVVAIDARTGRVLYAGVDD